MSDESLVTTSTRARALDPISKIGFMDGAADGQKATFQSSFDTGYKLGFSCGLELGKKEAKISIQNKEKPNELQLQDPRKINCQICMDNTSAQDNILNLYNTQMERNNELLNTLEMAINR